MERPTILLVEDDPNDSFMALREFERHHLVANVVLARNGIEAMEYLLCQGPYTDRSPGNPNVVLLDTRMPLMDGDAVLRFIRTTPALRDVPVLHMVSSPDDVGARTGAASIPKPVTVEELVAVAGQLGVHLSTS
jgi:CheY-like chemotaxis protein